MEFNVDLVSFFYLFFFFNCIEYMVSGIFFGKFLDF